MIYGLELGQLGPFFPASRPRPRRRQYEQTNMKLLTTAPPGSPAWHDAHKGRIGAASVADVLGCGRNTPLRRWAIITGKIEPEDISELPWVKMGNKLEPIVADLWEEETKRKLCPSPGVIQDEEFDWLIGTPDRMIAPTKDLEGGVWEGKTTSGFMRSSWEDDVPTPYRIQLQTYLRLTRSKWGSFGALVGGSEFLWKDEVHNPQFEQFMLNQLVDFWEKHVVKDIPPPATDREPDLRTIKQLHPEDTGETIDPGSEAGASIIALTEELHAVEAALAEAKVTVEPLEAEQKRLKAQIQLQMGSATWAPTIGGVWQYRCEPRSGYVVEPSRPRILRFKKEKSK